LTLWSVGHSTLSLADLTDLLATHGVRQVADIRSVPKSRRNPQFHVDVLPTGLRQAGIAYVHLPLLGGFRRPTESSPNTGWRNLSFRGYGDYALTEQFATGLAELRRLGREVPTAMMCSEGPWWRCHRRLVADRLVVAGEQVWHIGSRQVAAAHALTPFARVEPDGTITYPTPRRPAGPSAEE
jgi:uncharacterized protein (DUF488 family)